MPTYRTIKEIEDRWVKEIINLRTGRIDIHDNMFIFPHQLGKQKNLISHLKNRVNPLIKCKSVWCFDRQWEDRVLLECGAYNVSLTECQQCEYHKEGCCILKQQRYSR